MEKIFKYGNTFEYYHSDHYNEVEKTGGIYTVIIPDNFPVQFTEPLPSRSLKQCNQKYLYIGKSVNLFNRIKQYTQFLYYEGNIHKGGSPVRLIRNCEELIISYMTIHEIKYELTGLYNHAQNFPACSDISLSMETSLNELHKLGYGNLPFANSDEHENSSLQLRNHWRQFWIDVANKISRNNKKSYVDYQEKTRIHKEPRQRIINIPCRTLEDAMYIVLKNNGPMHYKDLAISIGKSGLWLRIDGEYPKKEQVYTRATRDDRFIINSAIVRLR